jgi:hypothetical protein
VVAAVLEEGIEVVAVVDVEAHRVEGQRHKLSGQRRKTFLT